MPNKYPVHGFNKPIEASQIMLVAGVDQYGNLRLLADSAAGVQTSIEGHFALDNPTTIRSATVTLVGAPVVVNLASLYTSTPARVKVFNNGETDIDVALTDLISSAPAIEHTLMGYAILDRGMTNGFGTLTLDGTGEATYEVYFA